VTRRSIRKALAACAVLALVVLAYAFYVEPYRVEVTHHRVTAPLARPLVIAHLSDLHIRGIGRREERVLAILEREAPDAIFVTGDTVDEPELADAARTLLERLHAPLGVWAVPGNWEHWVNTSPYTADRPSKAGVHYFVNEAARLRDDVWVVGLDDVLGGRPNGPHALKDVPRGATVFALFHSPMGIYQLRGRAAVAFAGHTHGGQIRLPFMKPLWLPSGSGRFVEGWYEEEGTKMFVSRGIGSSIVQARFFCRPEVAIVTIEPGAPSAPVE
jgi:predicted MPP superfamily phosphohydrolase